MKPGYAIVLSAGHGSRMGGNMAKQYQLLCEKPVLYYSLRAMEKSSVAGIVLVVSEGMQEYVQTEIVERYQISKVTAVTAGGKERYDSVYAGLSHVPKDSVVLIHDSARPFVTVGLIEQILTNAEERTACIPAVPVKDTIKIIDQGMVVETPSREQLYAVQTPQGFHTELLLQAYEQFWQQEDRRITDDASLVEKLTQQKVYQIPGEEYNIKLTTPFDMAVAQLLADEMQIERKNKKNK